MAAGIIDPLPQQAQAVAIGRRDCGHLKDRQPLLKFFANVLRRQMAVYFMVMLLPYQNRDRCPGNHHAIGITAHVDCMEYSSLDESVCFHGSSARAGFDPRCSDSTKGDAPQYFIITKKHSDIFRVLFGPLAQLVRATGS